MPRHEDRFKDPEFIAVWERWQKARNNWREVSKKVECSLFAPPYETFRPNPDLLPEHAKPAAVEFLEARTTYHKGLAALHVD